MVVAAVNLWVLHLLGNPYLTITLALKTIGLGLGLGLENVVLEHIPGLRIVKND